MFSPRGGVAGLPQGIDNFEKLGSNSLYPCPKSSECAFIFRHNFMSFLLKGPTCVKVVCQIPEGSDCFGSLLPRVSLPPHLCGKTLIGALSPTTCMSTTRLTNDRLVQLSESIFRNKPKKIFFLKKCILGKYKKFWCPETTFVFVFLKGGGGDVHQNKYSMLI